MKRLIFILIFGSILFTLQAQTPKIAHKSHSGTAITFHIDGLNDFGIHPDYIKKMKEKEQEQERKANEKALNCN